MQTTSAGLAPAGRISLGDLTVNRLGYGAMRVCGPDVWGAPKDRGAALNVLRRAYALGHTFFDTADSYGPRVDEELIAEALHPYPADLVIGTKGGLLRPNRHAWDPDGRPEHLRHALEGSLKRLQLDRIDLYQFHAPDSRVPFADSVGALAELQRAGKIRHIGVSNVSVKQLDEARRIAPIVSVQNRYNLVDRGSEGVLNYCAAQGIGFIPWYPVASGVLARGGGGLDELARDRGVSVAQLSIAWLLARSPVMLPIPGTSRVAHLEENCAAAEVTLDRATYDAIDGLRA